jgi:hypothetical protein
MSPIVEKVISGGQDGADLAGLMTARFLGIPTGGHMPKGYITRSGKHPDYKTKFNIEEHGSPAYPPRTQANVANSDGTIRLAVNFNSPGERCTLKYILQHKKPYIDIRVHEYPPKEGTTEPVFRIRISPNTVRTWIQRHSIKILNVAGNADQRIEAEVIRFLTEVLR